MHRCFIVYFFASFSTFSQIYKLFGMLLFRLGRQRCLPLPPPPKWRASHFEYVINFHEEENFSHCFTFSVVYHKSFLFSLPLVLCGTVYQFLLALYYFPPLLRLKMAQNSESTTSSYYHYYFYLDTPYIIMNVKWYRVKIHTSVMNCEPMRYRRRTSKHGLAFIAKMLQTKSNAIIMQLFRQRILMSLRLRTQMVLRPQKTKSRVKLTELTKANSIFRYGWRKATPPREPPPHVHSCNSNMNGDVLSLSGF